MKKILIGMMLAAAAGCVTTEPAKPEVPASETPAAVEVKKPEAPKPVEVKKPEAPKVAEAKKPEVKKPEAPKDQKIMDIRPDAAAKTGATSVEWENKNDAALKATVNDAAIAELLKGGAAAAAKLLAEVKPDFQTDPMKACLIAGVSQSVMCRQNAPYRSLWTKALLDAAAKAKTPDVVGYCLDQLRWCGTADQADAVLKIADAQSDAEVKKFAKMVAAEISGAQQNVILK